MPPTVGVSNAGVETRLSNTPQRAEMEEEEERVKERGGKFSVKSPSDNSKVENFAVATKRIRLFGGEEDMIVVKRKNEK